MSLLMYLDIYRGNLTEEVPRVDLYVHLALCFSTHLVPTAKNFLVLLVCFLVPMPRLPVKMHTLLHLTLTGGQPFHP
jgi:hypothetical protein